MDRLSLYLDLKKDELADLEIVARASLAFAATVREVAFIVDPNVHVRLEIESGTEGSLSLNSVVRFATKHVPDPVTRKVIIWSVIMWFVQETGSALLGFGVTDILSDDPQISEQEAEQIAKKVEELIERRVGQGPAKEVYRELDRDNSIKGVGVTTSKGERPNVIIPREEFLQRYEAPDALLIEHEPRINREQLVLTIISPVLTHNHNKWRFLSKYGTIYMAINDEAFLERLLSGRANIPMRSGITILAEVETEEVYDQEKEVWIPKERVIKRVISVEADNNSKDLFSD